MLQKQKNLKARVNQLRTEILTRGVNLGEGVHSDLKMLVDSAAADSQFFSRYFLERAEKNILAQQVKGLGGMP